MLVALAKVRAVIESCETPGQVETAGEMSRLFYAAYDNASAYNGLLMSLHCKLCQIRKTTKKHNDEKQSN